MPVDTPWRASIETVNAVPRDAWLSRTIVGSSSLSIIAVVHREADQAARVGRHEVDVLGRDELGGEHEIALVLAILVVDEDHHLAGADLLQRTRDAFDRAHTGLPSSFSTCFARMSTSRLIRSPTPSSPSVV